MIVSLTSTRKLIYRYIAGKKNLSVDNSFQANVYIVVFKRFRFFDECHTFLWSLSKSNDDHSNNGQKAS